MASLDYQRVYTVAICKNVVKKVSCCSLKIFVDEGFLFLYSVCIWVASRISPVTTAVSSIKSDQNVYDGLLLKFVLKAITSIVQLSVATLQ